MPRKTGDKNLHVLYRFRIKAGLSQSQLAELADISVREVGRLENGYGKYNATATTIGKLIKGFNATGLDLNPEDLAELLTQKNVSDRTKRRMKQQKRKQQNDKLQEEGVSSEADSQQSISFDNPANATNSLQLAT